ncbi:MAG TPA: diguanylate cyclase [Anaerolineales bacterium]|nr:diguanylate cyclase [Anaerolineales bacterium]
MKILVLNNDVMERSVIQQVLQHNGHEVVHADNSDNAMQILREGEIRFVIVERNTTDMEEKQFIKRLRSAEPPYYIYVLLIASKVQDTDITTPRGGADDYLHKPIVPLELKSRVHIGQRMLRLGDNLVNARGSAEKTAMFDPLTKTLNKAAFIILSRGELERARRGQAPLSLIALQVDNFNDIKEKYGEEISSDVLVLLAKSIREKSRPYDGVGRYKDDTFLLPLPGVIGQDAEKIAERIVKGMLNTDISTLDGTTIDLKLSTGIVSAQRISVSMEIETLIEKAIEAGARARQDGDNQVHTIFI